MVMCIGRFEVFVIWLLGLNVSGMGLFYSVVVDLWLMCWEFGICCVQSCVFFVCVCCCWRQGLFGLGFDGLGLMCVWSLGNGVLRFFLCSWLCFMFVLCVLCMLNMLLSWFGRRILCFIFLFFLFFFLFCLVYFQGLFILVVVFQ